MELKTLNLRKRRKEIKKALTDNLSKQTEKRLLIELKAKLEADLDENDKVMIEVEPHVNGEFQNILSDEILSMYDYDQLDANKYVFYNKSLDI
jgi:hypothetical protein